MKRVLVAGGTGFLGYHAIQEFLKKDWEVTALGLPPAPPPGFYPTQVKIVLVSLETASETELLELLAGHEALVFAAGADDRHLPKRPAYTYFHHGNVAIPERLLRLASQAGVKRAVVLGSYFTHFNRLWPEMRLAERHPYIRSRMEQEQAMTSIAGIETMVLELPYIFGALPIPGWKPLWLPLVKYIRSWSTIFYMKGGTACISARTAGRAILAAVENGQAGKCYPIGQENLTWKQMLSRLAEADGRKIRVCTLPAFLIDIGGRALWLLHRLQGSEHGLDPRYYSNIQTAQTTLDAEAAQKALGFEYGDLNEAFRETVNACPR